jgi:hypothetical protein
MDMADEAVPFHELLVGGRSVSGGCPDAARRVGLVEKSIAQTAALIGGGRATKLNRRRERQGANEMPAFPPMPGRPTGLGASGTFAVPQPSPSLNPAALGEIDPKDRTRQAGQAAIAHAMVIATEMCRVARDVHCNENLAIPERHRVVDAQTARIALPYLDTAEKTMAVYERDVRKLHEKLDAPATEYSELALTDARVKLSGLKPKQRFAAVRRSVDRGQMALRTEPIALRAERQTVRLVAIGAGDSGMIHATLNERAIFEHLATRLRGLRASSKFRSCDNPRLAPGPSLLTEDEARPQRQAPHSGQRAFFWMASIRDDFGIFLQ